MIFKTFIVSQTLKNDENLVFSIIIFSTVEKNKRKIWGSHGEGTEKLRLFLQWNESRRWYHHRKACTELLKKKSMYCMYFIVLSELKKNSFTLHLTQALECTLSSHQIPLDCSVQLLASPELKLNPLETPTYGITFTWSKKTDIN